jgi:hypothetical protein
MNERFTAFKVSLIVLFILTFPIWIGLFLYAYIFQNEQLYLDDEY